VAGEDDQPYTLRLTNMTGARVLVVLLMSGTVLAGWASCKGGFVFGDMGPGTGGPAPGLARGDAWRARPEGGAVAGAGLAAAAYGGYEVGKAIGQSQPVQKFAEKLGGIETIRKTEGKSAEEINKEAEEIKRKAAEARKSKKPSETTNSWTDYLPDLSGFLPS
jgi:hypothetical protein